MGKQILTIATLSSLILLAQVALQPEPLLAASLVTTIVTDPLTGVAINGMDPVSYFTETEPLQGKPDYEFDWGGVAWYFANQANRDIFMRAPEVYAPQFGGHCTMSLSRGFLSDGKPGLYMVVVGKLYLFYSSGNRDAFQLDEGAAIKGANANWGPLSKQLVAH